jgi:hypothetical protein
MVVSDVPIRKKEGQMAQDNAKGKKGTAKKASTRKTATAAEVEALRAQVTQAFERLDGHDTSLAEVRTALKETQEALGGLPAELQDRILEKVAENVPAEVRRTVIEMADAILLEGAKQSVLGIGRWVSDLAKKLFSVFREGAREGAKAVKQKHDDLHRSAEEGEADEVGVFGRIVRTFRRKPAEAAAAS